MPLIETSSYRSPFGLSNGHLQTIYPTVFRRQPIVDYARERIDTPDGDFLDLDWLKTGTTNRLVILTHGLESSSNSKYICGMAQVFERRGWHALAWNLRGCSGEPNACLTSYHSGSTGDLSTVINHAIRTQSYDTIALVGFSLGGNITLKYLGDIGNAVAPAIKAAVAFSVATDLASSAARLERFENKIYMRRFLTTLTDKVRYKMKQFPGKVAAAKLNRMRTFREFDGTYTAPLNGFENANDYWRRCSCSQVLSNISVPTLLVNAYNDPFLPEACYPSKVAQNHSKLYLETPRSGGHMGFIALNEENEYWSERRAIEFIQGYT